MANMSAGSSSASSSMPPPPAVPAPVNGSSSSTLSSTGLNGLGLATGSAATAPATTGVPVGMTVASTSHAADGVPITADLDAQCGGCHKLIDQESGGLVVAFGASLWHVDCFRCAKCKEKVSADTNLLLLSDGSPVCGNCSYQCFVCKQPITEEAIMTGDESYHAHCFTCRTCKRRIEELVFAKTSQGIYCMACHNERVAKSRRHAEAKRQRAARKEKEKEEEMRRQDSSSALRASTTSGSLNSHMGPATLSPQPPATDRNLAAASVSPGGGGPSGSASDHASPTFTPASNGSARLPDVGSPRAGRSPVASEDDHGRSTSAQQQQQQQQSSSLSDRRQRDFSLNQMAPRAGSPASLRGGEVLNYSLPRSPSDRNAAARQAISSQDGRSSPSSLQHPPPRDISLKHSASSSSSRTLGIGLGVGPVGSGGSSPTPAPIPLAPPPAASSLSPSLGVPTSRAERRRSINPGLSYSMDSQNSTFSTEPRPPNALPPSPLRPSYHEVQSEAIMGRSPTSPTFVGPGKEGFPFRKGSASSAGAGAPIAVVTAGGGGGGGGGVVAGSTSPDAQSFSNSYLGGAAARAGSPASQARRSPPINPNGGGGRLASPSAPANLSMRAEPTALYGGSNRDLANLTQGNHSHNGSTPRLVAPSLPAMSFSLSDPDFANILNSIEDPKQQQQQASGRQQPSGRILDEAGPAISLDESPPPSPGGQEGITRSPGSVDMLATASAGSAVDRKLSPDLAHVLSSTTMSAGGSRSRSHSASGAIPGLMTTTGNALPAPQFLSSRQHSADSVVSSASRNGPNSAFGVLSELVSKANGPSSDGTDRGIEVDLALLSRVIVEMEEMKQDMSELRAKYSGAKRTSQQYSEGLTVAGEEYDKEVALRRDAEAEVIRLKAQVHSQTARLSVVSGDERRQETMRRRSHDLANSLSVMERDISKLRAQRDMTLAEVEELGRARNSLDGSPDAATAQLGNALSSRLDTIKEQYKEELEPLTAQREALQREIVELREAREQVLEESTALSAKNDMLTELNGQLSRQVESLQDSISSRTRAPVAFLPRKTTSHQHHHHPSSSPSMSSLATSATLHEVPEETARVVKVTKPEPQPIEQAPARRFKWYKSSKGPEAMTSMANATISRPIALAPPNQRDKKMLLQQRPSTEFGTREHTFQQHSTMRFTRCELCAEKMWGLQEVRCASCGMVCHAKCAEKLPKSCTGSKAGRVEINDGPMPPSMFGKELSEQIVADNAAVPVIVTKCIYAVEAVGMDYEGIYRKTGGSSQSKQIQQLFERGDYDAFDLSDIDAFNDISSVTSVFKTYLRQLPNPLLTHKLHESFVAAAGIQNATNKHQALCSLLQELPKDHYNVLRTLMLHLHRVASHSDVNLMTSQNLGVVFGPTLMRSSDPNREFGDMAGKALSVQWMIDNAPQVFAEVRS